MAVNLGKAYVTVMPSTKGFISTLAKEASGAGTTAGESAGNQFSASLGSVIKGSAIFSIVQGAMQQVGSVISSSLDSAISRADTLNTFPTIMKNLGYSADDASVQVTKLADGIEGLPTTLDSITDLAAQVAPLTDSLGEATDVSLAFNNMLVASGKPLEEQQRAMQQYTQALAKGKPDMMDWRTLQSVMPGQLDQVAKHMLGAEASTTTLYEALRDGKITMQDFNQAMVDMNNTDLTGYGSFAQQAQENCHTVQTSIQNMKTAVTKNIANMITELQKSGLLISFFDSMKDAINDVGATLTNFGKAIGRGFDLDAFIEAFNGLKDAFLAPFSEGEDAADSFGEAVGDMANIVTDVLKALTPLASVLGNAIKLLADNMDKVTPVAKTLVEALIGFKVIKTITGFIPGLNTSLGTLAKALGTKLTSPLKTLGTKLSTPFTKLGDKIKSLGDDAESSTGGLDKLGSSTEETAKKAGKSTGQLLGTAAVIASIGASIWLASTGFATLASALTELADRGGAGVAVLGMAGATLVGLTAILAMLTPTMASAAVPMLAIGGAIAIMSLGFSVLVLALTQLASTGAAGIAVLAVAGVILAGLIITVGLLAPVLAAAAVPMLAIGIGVGVLAAGVGVLLSALAALLDSFVGLCEQLPIIAEYGLQASVNLFALGASLVVVGAGAIVAGAGALVLAAGLIAVGAGLLLCSAPLLIISAAILVAGAGMTLFGAGALVAAAGIGALAAPLLAVMASLAMLVPVLLAISVEIAAFALAAGAAAIAVGMSNFVYGVFADNMVKAADATTKIHSELDGVAGAAGWAASNLESANGAFSGIQGASDNAASAIRNAQDASDNLSSALNWLKEEITNSSTAVTLLSTAFSTLSSGVSAAGGSVTSTLDTISSAITSVVDTAKSGVQSIVDAFSGMQLTIPSPTLGKMPHFRMVGGFNYETGEVPSISVDWYAKGAIFKRPAVIGVGDSSTPEVVTPLAKLQGFLDKAMDGKQGKTIEQTFNVNTNDPALCAAVVASKLRRSF